MKKKHSHDSRLSLRMKLFRKKMGVSMSDMSLVCGIGANQWALWEKKDNSKIERAKRNLILIATTPKGFYHLASIVVTNPIKRAKIMLKAAKAMNELEQMTLKHEHYLNTNFWYL